jgi:hypothetical protein
MTLLKTVRNSIRSWLQSDEPSPNRGRTRLSFENLESRENPSSIVYNAINDVITVTGSQHDDHLVVETVNGGGFLQLPILKLSLTDSAGGKTTHSHSTLGGPVSKIVFNGFGGNDSNRHYVSIPLLANGGSGDDFLVGGSGNDELNGEGGVDRLFGLGGNDILDGGAAGDYLYGGAGDDHLIGVGGNDFLYGHDGDDLLQGGIGADRLYGNGGNDAVYGGTGNDQLYGGDGADFLEGSFDNDLLYGEGGNDQLSGSGGDDQLYGGSGRDALLGWTGNDLLVGGNGPDRYLRTPNLTNNGLDITSFSSIDVAFHFSNGTHTQVSLGGESFTVNGGSWTLGEIWSADQALGVMVERTGSNGLLKRQDGDPIHLYRYGAMYDSSFQPTTQFSAWNSNNGNIALAGSAFASDAGLRRTIYHEIGHNWDNEGPSWSTFLVLSGWSNPINAIAFPSQFDMSLDGAWAYKAGTEFAREYGKTNPYEDFATCFEQYFADLENGMTPSSGASGTLNSKLTWVHTVLDLI